MGQGPSTNRNNQALGLLVVSAAVLGIAAAMLMLDGVARAGLAGVLALVAVVAATYMVTAGTAKGTDQS